MAGGVIAAVEKAELAKAARKGRRKVAGKPVIPQRVQANRARCGWGGVGLGRNGEQGQQTVADHVVQASAADGVREQLLGDALAQGREMVLAARFASGGSAFRKRQRGRQRSGTSGPVGATA